MGTAQSPPRAHMHCSTIVHRAGHNSRGKLREYGYGGASLARLARSVSAAASMLGLMRRHVSIEHRGSTSVRMARCSRRGRCRAAPKSSRTIITPRRHRQRRTTAPEAPRGPRGEMEEGGRRGRGQGTRGHSPPLQHTENNVALEAGKHAREDGDLRLARCPDRSCAWSGTARELGHPLADHPAATCCRPRILHIFTRAGGPVLCGCGGNRWTSGPCSTRPGDPRGGDDLFWVYRSCLATGFGLSAWFW